MPAIAMPIKPADSKPTATDAKKTVKTKAPAEDPAAAKMAAVRGKNLDLAILDLDLKISIWKNLDLDLRHKI